MMEFHALPHRDTNTAVVEKIRVPDKRSALFLAIETDAFHEKLSDELSFGALSPNDKALIQFLLYLTYCFKGEFIQVTLENTDFYNMTAPIREDFSHGRLFCFVFDLSKNDLCDTNSQCLDHRSRGSFNRPGTSNDRSENVSSSQLHRLINIGSVDMNVFMQDDSDDQSDDNDYNDEEEEEEEEEENNEMFKEAFNAFMRLQLVRKKACSLNNAMINMTDSNGDLSSIFNWIDIVSDTLNCNKIERKKVKELQGSMFTPASQSGRLVSGLPDSIMNLNLEALDDSIGRITDKTFEGKGNALFMEIMSKLTTSGWLAQKVMLNYDWNLGRDYRYMMRLKDFTKGLSGHSGSSEVDCRGLLVFRYSLGKLINTEKPDLFTNTLIHRHMPIPKCRIEKVLSEIKSRNRTRHLARLLMSGLCHCEKRYGESRECSGDCQTAYTCFYNFSEFHPFVVSGDDHGHYFGHLYPYLGKLERLSREMKLKYKGRKQFDSISDMVFDILARHRITEKESLYEGLSELIDNTMDNSRLSLGHGDLAVIHELLYLAPCNLEDYSEEPCKLHPMKVYDHMLVRYLFCDTLQVGRLFQASVTFNYIIINTAPRYTIERIMLFNITGPGEGKSYANNVLNYQFSKVKGCIETLTSFTPQAFKYKQKRSSCVVMIDDAHITHEKNIKALDKESNVIPNTFKNLLDTSILESDVVSRDPNSGKVDTVKYQAVHNCGFVWNTNTLGFVSDAWADRCVIMDSEFPVRVTRTRSTKQIQDTVERQKMDRIAAVCLYRQNLIQSATMIAESDIMQFGVRFDTARDACVAALHATHIVCTGAVSRRAPFCINQLVFAEAMKLACHFVFDIWIPPWTESPDIEDYRDLRGYMKQMNDNRLQALNKLSFGEICLETNAVYKLCAAACLPDLCPRAVDTQGRFACRALGYMLTQIYKQNLKTVLKNGNLCVSGIDKMFFSEKEIVGGDDVAHEMLRLCATCRVPARGGGGLSGNSYKLCTYRCLINQNAQHSRRGHSNSPKKVASVTVPLEAVYDFLAIYAPDSHSAFWDQLSTAILEANDREDFEEVNAFGQFEEVDADNQQVNESHPEKKHSRTLQFTLDFNGDPLCSLILEATRAIEPLNELTFNKCTVGGNVFRCSAPVFYGGILVKAMSQRAPEECYDERHLKESRLGRRGTFHGPRLSVYSGDYSGVPVKNMSSFCTTRTVYHQDRIFLRVNHEECGHLFELEEDWEWKDATEVFNTIHGGDVFSVERLKQDYAATMMVGKGELPNMYPGESEKLKVMIRHLRSSDGNTALKMRKGVTLNTQDHRMRKRTKKHAMEGLRRVSGQRDRIDDDDNDDDDDDDGRSAVRGRAKKYKQ